MLAVEKRVPERERAREMKTHVMPCAAAVCAILGSGPASAGLALPTDVPLRLADHPDGSAAPPSYGLRLDELINLTGGQDRFTFSFDHPLAMMQIQITENLQDEGTYRIDIWGQAFGGRIVNNEYDPLMSGLVDIEFTYMLAHLADGDDDLIVTTPDFMNSGSIRFNGTTIDLFDRANDEGFTFRLGNEDDDLGHRGFDGFSGWGWIGHGVAGTPNPTSDWLFTVVPTPGTTVLMAMAAVMLARGRNRRR